MTRLRGPRVVAAALLLVGVAAACGPSRGERVSGAGPTVPTPAGTSAPAPTTPPAGKGTSRTPLALRYVFPVAGHVEYAREHHDYPATDILASCGSPVRAVTTGVVLEVIRVDRYDPRVNDGATRGGLAVSMLGADGVRYYGSHLSRIEPGIVPGRRVTAGQRLGSVGETGDASACHLHFGISPACTRRADWWIRRGVLWPWPYLDSWRSGGHSSPRAAVDAWQSAHGCPASAPPGA
jgi:murein DD-endopeptidase MepM/ murein hydrolase activator NlpD